MKPDRTKPSSVRMPDDMIWRKYGVWYDSGSLEGGWIAADTRAVPPTRFKFSTAYEAIKKQLEIDAGWARHDQACKNDT